MTYSTIAATLVLPVKSHGMARCHGVLGLNFEGGRGLLLSTG
jgi:hypothetical protein